MNTIKQLCDICTEDRPKATFQFCTTCLNTVCADCKPLMEKCPHCRTQPYETMSLVKPDKPVVKKNKDTLSIKGNILCALGTVQIYLGKCKCRVGCKHKRCDCATHNAKYEAKHLESIVQDLHYVLWAKMTKLDPTEMELIYDLIYNDDQFNQRSNQLNLYNTHHPDEIRNTLAVSKAKALVKDIKKTLREAVTEH